MNDRVTREVVKVLLSKEVEINNKINSTICELLRLGYESERGKEKVKELRESIEYSLDEMDRILDRVT